MKFYKSVVVVVFFVSVIKWSSCHFLELSLMLNLERDEFTPMNPVVRARMTIHSPDIVPNPQYDGVSLQPGRTYNYGVRKVFHIGL